MIMKQKDLDFSNKKQIISTIFKYIGLFFAWIFILIFLSLIGFIIYQSIPGWEKYGPSIIVGDKFDIYNNTNPQGSVWLPLSITLLTVTGALLFAVPISIKTATFIKLRVRNPNLQKSIKIFIETVSGVPSVIFGLFASQSLGFVVSRIFGISSNYSILTAIFMLGMMVMPTIISLTLNAYEGVSLSLIDNSLVLGTTRTRAIYKVFRKQTRGQIIIAIFVAFGRAVGETMAISMILSSQQYESVFESGNVLSSLLRPLGAVISYNMFAENGNKSTEGLLYAFGIILFIIVMVLNIIVMVLARKRSNKLFYSSWYINFQKFINNTFYLIPNLVGKYILKNDDVNTNNINNYISNHFHKSKTTHLYSYYKYFWEVLCLLISIFLFSWLILDVVANGIYATTLSTSTVFLFTKDTTGQALVATIVMILITILISFPISLIIALYINEYQKDSIFKKIIFFFIDSLGSTPSILFGMFGLAFFINTLGITSAGSVGYSMIAGALTLTIVLLPSFIRVLQQSLNTISQDVRTNAIALGATRFQVIWSLIIPGSIRSIISSIVLMFGRIVSETAPLYLTAGLFSASSIGLLSPAQTLTTRIYAQLFSGNITQGVNIMYESAITNFVLIAIFSLIGHLLIPNISNIITKFKDYFHLIKYKANIYDKKILKKYQTQIYKKKIYLTSEQANELKIDLNNTKSIFVKFKLLEIVEVSKSDLIKLQDKIIQGW